MKKRSLTISLLAFVCLCLCSCDFIFPSFSQGSYSYRSGTISSSSSSSSSDDISSSSIPLSYDNSLAYNGYYQSLQSWENGEDLKNKLYTIIRKDFNPCSYAGSTVNYESNSKADHSKYDFEILDVAYSDVDLFYTATSKGWQREHAFCASLMCGTTTGDAVKTKGRATDFHNLFAAEASANGTRGNKNYGNADKNASSYRDYTINNGYDGYSYDNTNFEPGDKDKGRLARAIFYMATMYQEDEYDEKSHITMKGLNVVEGPVTYVSGNDGNFAIGNLSTLIAWSNENAVDYLEMQHNISVYKDVISIDGHAQGNRNPYVDFPLLVDYVFGNKKEMSGTINDLVASEALLNCYQHDFSHYALKSAKREYGIGETIANSDFEIVKVYQDYSTEKIITGFDHALKDQILNSDNGLSLDTKITIGQQEIFYTISLDPMQATTTGVIYFNNITNIDKKKPNIAQSVNYGGIDFLLTYTTSYANASSDGVLINNIVTNGPGITFGGPSKPITSLTIQSVNQYYVDQAYAKACVGNQNSSYQLSIKVGETTILENDVINNSDNIFMLHGASVDTPAYGHITFVFNGANSLKLNSIAFNYINA